MRALLIVLAAPALPEGLRFFEVGEALRVQELVAQTGVERLAIAVLPGLAGFDVQDGDFLMAMYTPIPRSKRRGSEKLLHEALDWLAAAYPEQRFATGFGWLSAKCLLNLGYNAGRSVCHEDAYLYDVDKDSLTLVLASTG